MNYEFTNNWFEITATLWHHLPQINRALEIGSYEGRSAVWLLENKLTDDGKLVCIDTWEGGLEHTGQDFKMVEDRFDRNINIAKKPNQVVHKIKTSSAHGLATCLTAGERFDFVYVDGSHFAKDVLSDACAAWPMLEKNGIMVFDDYLWRGDPRDILRHPKIAVDTFTNLFSEELRIASLSAQIMVQKL